jgi:hypothetical protein
MELACVGDPLVDEDDRRPRQPEEVDQLLARIGTGQILGLDEPVDLPEGAVVDLVPADASDDLDDDERARLAAAIAESRAEIARGEGRPAADVLAALRAVVARWVHGAAPEARAAGA